MKNNYRPFTVRYRWTDLGGSIFYVEVKARTSDEAIRKLKNQIEDQPYSQFMIILDAKLTYADLLDS